MSGWVKESYPHPHSKTFTKLPVKVSCVKIDPYVNYDAGTMNPVAHGEVL